MFSRVKQAIRKGDLFQCVISQRFKLTRAPNPIRLFAQLCTSKHSPYTYLIEHGDTTVVGASPETLVQIKDRQIETFPIAGTRQRGRSNTEDSKLRRNLLRSRKESAEHLMLVDLSRNDLGRICLAGSVRVSKYRRVTYLPNVMHLVSQVCGTLQPTVDRFAALASCFPAGTLTGAPKISAMHLIRELEQQFRGIYGGSIFFGDLSNNLDACIAIRTLVIRNGKAHLQAGAGIVEDSRMDREFKEITNKTMHIVAALSGGTNYDCHN